MAVVGDVVLYVIMAFVVIGAIAAIRDDKKGMGAEFINGLYSIGPIFLPVAGIMASIPYLSKLVEVVVAPVWSAAGADPALAATTLIASDMGGYQLAESVSGSDAAWIMALITGFMAGATIVFSIPVGLAMLDKKDHKYMALGIMSGILAIPIGVLISTATIKLADVQVRGEAATTGPSDVSLDLTWGSILVNLIPVTIFLVVVAVGLKMVPDVMVRIFLTFGRLMDAAIKIVLAVVIVEYFTGFGSRVFGAWGFDPIIADTEDQFRALEVAGYIGIVLAGAFPMVYAIRTYLAGPVAAAGRRLGMSPEGATGVLAAAANILALYHLIAKMPAKDKVMTIAFATCSAFLLGDHLSFTANFQPTLIGPVMLGKLTAGILAMLLALWIAVPSAQRMEREELRDGDGTRRPGGTDEDTAAPTPA
ncbi:ethanolamine utilization protein EutH [Nocardioides coralli]|uniref:ethanolamine utilization protein EutH n=1 Tax=Nocardioides coralli TaxID=2872154 RepID=UPI001CA38CB3|nr:ethanolamine utilization protein EutH [Nocardioides coralli]QZY29779.1 ethanolamine utilization protein EutH [Nocardioides coralli]